MTNFEPRRGPHDFDLLYISDICPISIILFALLFLSVTLFVRVIHIVLRQIPREMKNGKPRNLRFFPVLTRKVSVNPNLVIFLIRIVLRGGMTHCHISPTSPSYNTHIWDYTSKHAG